MFWALIASVQQEGVSRGERLMLGRAVRKVGRRMRARVGMMVVFILMVFFGVGTLNGGFVGWEKISNDVAECTASRDLMYQSVRK